MKKKILAMLLAVALTAALAVPALAAEAPTLYHCTCGAKWFASAEETTPSIKNEACAAGCLQTKNLAWLPLSENLTSSGAAPVKGNFYVDQEKITLAITYPQILRIDLNGNTLTRAQNSVFHLSGSNAEHLLITDTSDNKDGVLMSDKWAGGNGAVVRVDNGVCIMLAGTIQGATAAAGELKGGAVSLNKGKSVYAGAKFYMYGGTITGGHAHSGGNVAVMDASNEFYMYGGVIENGVTPGTAQQHAGNVRVEAGGKFVMTGGTIQNGVANGKDVAYPARGGNIMATGAGTTVTIGGTAKILGGTAHDATANSIFINTDATLNVSGGRIEKEVLVRNEEKAKADANITGGQFDASNLSTWVDYTNGALTLTDDLSFVGALEIAENVTINLAGHKIDGGVNVAADKVLTLADTSTDDYTTAGVMVKVTGEGTVKRDAVVNSKRYVAIKETVNEDTYYSAHRIYLAVTSSVLSNGCSAMNFKTVLKCNNYVAMRVEEYGVTVGGVTENYQDANVAAGNNEKTTTLTGFLKGDADDATWAATDVQVGATFKLDDGTVINSAVKARSLQTMVEEVVKNWNGLDADQQTTLKTLYATYGQSAAMDNWAIPAEMKAN